MPALEVWHRIEHRYRGIDREWYVVCAACWDDHALKPSRYVDGGGGIQELIVKAIGPPTGEACHWCDREAE